MSQKSQSHYAQAGQLSVCSRCGKELGFFDRLSPAKKIYRCRDCNNQVQQSLQRFRQRFLEVTLFTALSSTQWHELQMLAAHERLDMPEVLAFIQADALALVERIVAFAEARNELFPGTEQHIFHLHATLVLPNEVMQSFYQRLAALKQRINVQQFYRAVAQIEAYADVTEEAVHYMQQLQKTLALPPDKAQSGLQRVAYARQMSDIRKGKFLTIRTSVQLESDEILRSRSRNANIAQAIIYQPRCGGHSRPDALASKRKREGGGLLIPSHEMRNGLNLANASLN